MISVKIACWYARSEYGTTDSVTDTLLRHFSDVEESVLRMG